MASNEHGLYALIKFILIYLFNRNCLLWKFKDSKLFLDIFLDFSVVILLLIYIINLFENEIWNLINI